MGFLNFISFTLPETNSQFAPENSQKERQTSSNHPFSRDMLVSGRVLKLCVRLQGDPPRIPMTFQHGHPTVIPPADSETDGFFWDRLQGLKVGEVPGISK